VWWRRRQRGRSGRSCWWWYRRRRRRGWVRRLRGAGYWRAVFEASRVRLVVAVEGVGARERDRGRGGDVGGGTAERVPVPLGRGAALGRVERTQVDSPGRDAGARLPSPLPPLLLVLQGTRRRWRWRRRRRRRRRTRREGWAWHRAEAEAPLSLTRRLGHGIAVEGASVSADGGMKATLSVECDRGNVGSLAPAPITHCSGGERDAERIEERAHARG